MKDIKKYWNDIFFQTLGNSFAQVVGIIGMPLLTRIYSPEAFAIQAIFLQLVMLFAGFISLRYEYFIPLTENQTESASLINFILKFGIKSTLVFCLFVGIVLNYLETFGIIHKEKYWVLILSPIVAFAVSISMAFQHEAQREIDFASSAKSEVSNKICYILSGIVLSILGNAIGLVLTTFFGAIGKILSLHKYFRRYLSYIKKNHQVKIINKYKKRSTAMVASNIILLITSLMPILFIEKQFGSDVLGNYSLVLGTIFLPSSIIGAAIGSVFYQRCAEMINEKKQHQIIGLWNVSILKLIYIGLPAYLIIGVISPYFYPLVFGAKWELAGEFGQKMAIAAFASFLAGPLDRLSLICNVSYYIPMFNILRLLLISLVLWLSYFYELGFSSVIFLIADVLFVIYFLDVLLGRYFLINKILEND